MAGIDEVEFDEVKVFDEIPHPKIEPPTFGEGLMNLGIARNPGDAAILMAIFAFLLICLGIYFLATSVPQEKSLSGSPEKQEQASQGN